MTQVVARILDALLRENYADLRSYVAGDRLVFPTGWVVRLQSDRCGFLSTQTVVPEAHLTLDRLFAALRSVADPRDDLTSFEAECRAELTAVRLRREALATLTSRCTPLGPGTYYDTLAAFTRHPVYPTSQARPGLSEADIRAYAPEFAPSFLLRWAAVARDKAVMSGVLPSWWPRPADVGLRDSDDVVLFPVHPLTTLPTAPRPYLEVTPTLSMRTVCVAVDPAVHLKLPLPTSTLGQRNRRSIVPRTLSDGALVQRLLARLVPPGVLLADEQSYGHAHDDMLGFLVRRMPPATRDARVVPVAALLATGPDGLLVVEALGQDVESFFGRYLNAVFGLAVPLFTRYGVALETHQQNLALVIQDNELSLLIKDNDGPLLHPDLRETSELTDRRLVSDDQEALARVFVTITLHLCAGALAFGLAERGRLPLRTGLRLVRDHLDQALSEEGRSADFLRARTLDADTLPTKAMLTAGTLVDKERTGAADINKHYGPPAPNYLRGHHL